MQPFYRMVPCIPSEYFQTNVFKDARSGLIQLLANGSPLKMMKNAFYFTLKVLFVLNIFKFLS